MAAKITLYTFPPSHNAFRVEFALREKQLDFEKVCLDLFKGEHIPALAELTPRGQVPTLVYEDGGERIVVYESIAIIRFIDAVCPEPPLMPPAGDKVALAEALMRIEEFQAKFDPKNIFGSVVFGGMNREQLGNRVDNLLIELERWNAYLEGRDYLIGERLTLADIAVFPLLMHFEALGYDYAKHTPALAAFLERCKSRPSVRDSGWLDLFSAFVAERNPVRVLE